MAVILQEGPLDAQATAEVKRLVQTFQPAARATSQSSWTRIANLNWPSVRIVGGPRGELPLLPPVPGIWPVNQESSVAGVEIDASARALTLPLLDCLSSTVTGLEKHSTTHSDAILRPCRLHGL